MSLIYRAIWQDEPTRIHARARDAFGWWVNLRNPGSRSLEADVEETIGGATTLVRAGAAESGSIQRCTVHVDDGSERLTTTLITTSSHDGAASVWVDQERVSRDVFAPFQVHAPELSTKMIATGIRPRHGPIGLQPKPKALKPEAVRDFVDLLTRGDRDLPVVVFATGPDFDGNACLEAGTHAARVLAGSAAVYLVDKGRFPLAELLGDDLAVEPGGARLYLPGLSPDESEPWRHRSLEAERVARDPKAIAHTIVQLLAPATAARRSPPEYPTLRHLLQSGPGSDAEDHENQAVRITDLEDQLAARENQILSLVADLEESTGRVNELQDSLVHLLVSGAIGDGDDSDRYSAEISCCSDAASAAQSHLTGIALSDSACRDLSALDRLLEARTWGQTAWRAFVALNAFALDRSFGPGFWEWCVAGRSPLTWPATPKKLAMHESESVMNSAALRATRRFAVDPRVAPQGRIVMEAHLKVAEGGGPQIPRIYFHDDRKGVTGKVHIGFFGPHHLVPTSSYS